MSGGPLEIVIVGTTASGRTFRPTDWAERLCGMMSVFGEDRQLSYSPYLKPITLRDGARGVVVSRQLGVVDPAAYAFVLAFVSDNELTCRDGRTGQRQESAGLAAAGAGTAS